MTPILNLALRAARQVNEYIVQTIDKRDPATSDTSADQKMMAHLEETLFDVLFDNLKRGYPKHYLAQPGETLRDEKEDSWHIGGFDNIIAYARRLPSASYTLTHKHKGKVSDVVVCNPFTGDEYTASKGSGAALNDRRIRCNAVKSMSNALIATNALSRLKTSDSAYQVNDFLAELANNTGALIGSSSPELDLAMVSAGQVDAAILIDCKLDALEGALQLCAESGALTGSLGGELITSQTKHANLVVANPKLYKSLIQRFGGYDKKLA